MDHERWKSLIKDDQLPLSQEEIKEGWHFCVDWDGLLIGPGMGELDLCMCDRESDVRDRPTPMDPTA